MLRHRVFFSISSISRGMSVWAASLIAISCSGPAPLASDETLPTAPSPSVTGMAAAGTDRSLPASPHEETLFSFVDGTFVITTDAGDSLTGLYFGHLAIPIPGRSTISIGLLATGGSGVFRGASGVITGDGGGEFEFGKEGHVVVSSATGILQTAAAPAGFKFQITIGGTSVLSCSASSRTQLTIRGDGSIATVGRARVLLTSEISNTFCVS